MIDSLRVAAITKNAMEQILLPARHNLAKLDVQDKGAGELVTSVDLECQKFIESELSRILPKAYFLGEEFLESNNADLNRLEEFETLWIVDPLDGTVPYAANKLSFAVQIAFVVNGLVQGAWIAIPYVIEGERVGCKVFYAYANGPALVDGQPITKVSQFSRSELIGIVGKKYADPEFLNNLKKYATELGECSPPTSAGYDMIGLVEGKIDYMIYNRTLPWDFAAPLFWGTAAGIFVRRFNGGSVKLDQDSSGLVCARTASDWQNVHSKIIIRSSDNFKNIKVSQDSTIRV